MTTVLLLLCVLAASVAQEVEDINRESPALQEYKSAVQSLKDELEAQFSQAGKRDEAAKKSELITALTRNNSELQSRMSELEDRLNSHFENMKLTQLVTKLHEEKIRFLEREKEHTVEMCSQRLELEQFKKAALEEESKSLKLHLTDVNRKLNETEDKKQEVEFENVRLKREIRDLSSEIEKLREDQQEIRGIIVNKTDELSSQMHSVIKGFKENLLKLELNVTKNYNSSIQLVQECNEKYAILDGVQLNSNENVIKLFNQTKSMSHDIIALDIAVKAAQMEAVNSSTTSEAANSIAKQARQSAEECKSEITEGKKTADKVKETADVALNMSREVQTKLDKLELAVRYFIVKEKLELIQLGDSYYHFHAQGKKSWNEASHFCVSHHMQLANIGSNTENDLLSQQLQKIGNFDAWIGGTDEAQEGHWVWRDSGLQIEFTKWDPLHKEPNGGRGENCMELRKTGGWNDRNCNFSNIFICELPSQ